MARTQLSGPPKRGKTWQSNNEQDGKRQQKGGACVESIIRQFKEKKGNYGRELGLLNCLGYQLGIPFVLLVVWDSISFV